jgi:hypothetical protein
MCGAKNIRRKGVGVLAVCPDPSGGAATSKLVLGFTCPTCACSHANAIVPGRSTMSAFLHKPFPVALYVSICVSVSVLACVPDPGICCCGIPHPSANQRRGDARVPLALHAADVHKRSYMRRGRQAGCKVRLAHGGGRVSLWLSSWCR